MEPICGKCGGPMSVNPHPDAGKYENYVEVGAKYECIPCQRANIHYRSNEMGRMSKSIDDLEAQLAAYAELREAAEEYRNEDPCQTCDMPQRCSLKGKEERGYNPCHMKIVHMRLIATLDKLEG